MKENENGIKALNNAQIITELENACFSVCHKPTKVNERRLSEIEAECARRFDFDVTDIKN